MTTIVSVVEREPRGRSWWLITASDGQKYSTRSMWLAALAEQYRNQGKPVTFGSSAGWHYRDLYSIKADGEEVQV